MGIFALVFAAWGYLFYHAWQMSHIPMSEMWMPPASLSLWPVSGFIWVYSMWAVMMAAMILPTALPMIGAFSRYTKSQQLLSDCLTRWFISGYLTVWFGFSLVLTGLQWLFHGMAWLSPMMENRHPFFATVILIAAGLYQFTPIKNACLQHCRTPFGFLINEWRPGQSGALQMGIKHGINCLGCCWVQMLIMFVVGVMNLWGMIFITLLVIVEKWLPGKTKIISRSIGIFFLAWAGFLWINLLFS